MRSHLASVAATAALLGTVVVNAALPPVIPGGTVTTSGNGCPQDAANGKYVSGSGDWTDLSLTLHNFTAQYPLITQRTVNCEAHITAVNVTSGWQVSPVNVSISGYASLDPGVTLTSYVTAYWSSDASNTATVQSGYENTNSKKVSALVSVDDAVSLWSPCVTSNGQLDILNINFRVALSGDDSTSETGYFGPQFSGTSEKTSVVEEIQFAWRKC